MTQHAMPCHAIPVQYIAYAKFSFGHHPNPRLSKFAQVDVLRDALKDVLHVVEIFSAQSEAREPRTRNRSLDPRRFFAVWKVGLNGPWRETETTTRGTSGDSRGALLVPLQQQPSGSTWGSPEVQQKLRSWNPTKPNKNEAFQETSLGSLMEVVTTNHKYSIIQSISQICIKTIWNILFSVADIPVLGMCRWLRLHGFPQLCVQPLWLLLGGSSGRQVEWFPPMSVWKWGISPWFPPQFLGSRVPGFSWIFSCFSVDSN